MYSETILEHFRNPRHLGELSDIRGTYCAIGTTRQKEESFLLELRVLFWLKLPYYIVWLELGGPFVRLVYR